tara:strand:- start:1598 stop:1774 length:177 start_codon:yes stop_codon:yes gene_type:complete
MRRASKKEKNLNKLKTGCSPCLKEAKDMEKKFSEQKNSKNNKEVQAIMSSMFNKKLKV